MEPKSQNERSNQQSNSTLEKKIILNNASIKKFSPKKNSFSKKNRQKIFQSTCFDLEKLPWPQSWPTTNKAHIIVPFQFDFNGKKFNIETINVSIKKSDHENKSLCEFKQL